jgi:hypothetical protein
MADIEDMTANEFINLVAAADTLLSIGVENVSSDSNMNDDFVEDVNLDFNILDLDVMENYDYDYSISGSSDETSAMSSSISGSSDETSETPMSSDSGIGTSIVDTHMEENDNSDNDDGQDDPELCESLLEYFAAHYNCLGTKTDSSTQTDDHDKDSVPSFNEKVDNWVVSTPYRRWSLRTRKPPVFMGVDRVRSNHFMGKVY